MDRNEELHDDDRTDLGAASVETKGIPTGQNEAFLQVQLGGLSDD